MPSPAAKLLFALPLGLFALLASRGAQAAETPPPPAPPDVPADLAPLYAPFPVDPANLPATSPQRERLERLAAAAEQASGIPDLAQFLLASAYTESRFYTTAINTDDGPAALSLLCNKRNRDRFAGNPWLPAVTSTAACKADVRGLRWKYSGGWLGLMPAVALASSNAAHMMDPARVFDPAYAVAFATQHVRNLHRNYDGRDYQSIRAGWAAPSFAHPGIQSDREALSAKHFAEAIAATGVRPDLASRQVQVPGSYPGLLPILIAVLEADGRPLPSAVQSPGGPQT